MNAKLQIIHRDGRPEWAVIPYEEYERLSALAEDYEDIRAFDDAKRALEEGEELIPSTVVDRLMEGEPPLKVWREYRGFTTESIAKHLGIEESRIVKIEEGEEVISGKLLTRLAVILHLDTDDLIA